MYNYSNIEKIIISHFNGLGWSYKLCTEVKNYGLVETHLTVYNGIYCMTIVFYEEYGIYLDISDGYNRPLAFIKDDAEEILECVLQGNKEYFKKVVNYLINTTPEKTINKMKSTWKKQEKDIKAKFLSTL